MPEDVATLGSLIDRRRTVAWGCDVGKALGHVGDHGGTVNLEALLLTKGPGFSLANRRPPCPVKNCPGRVSFRDASSVHWQPLDTITDRDPAWWNYSETVYAERFALGWRIEAGYWMPPEGWPKIGG